MRNTITTPETYGQSTWLRHGPLAWLASGIDAWMGWLERRAQIRQLQAMDEWQLKDIGVTRADVLRVSKGDTRPYY